jgi:hypothetical protein
MFSVGVGGVTAVVELVVVVQAVSTADAQPRENARREMPGARGSDEGEGGDDFKKFSSDAAGTGVESCSSHSVKPSSNGAHDKT